MVVITSIKQQKGKKDRVNVYLDNKFGFGIDLDNFVLLNLRVNQELTDSEIEKIVRKAEFQKTLDKLLRFAMVRPKSEKELRDYLYRKKVPNLIWEDLFSKLKSYELLNDTKFAKWWVESRQEFRPKPKRMITQELRMKGIGKDIIDKVLGETKFDEEKIAKDLVKSRENHWRAIEKPKRNQKKIEYLIGKGFSYDIAKKVVSGYNSSEDDEVS